jgi:hypothetical protein
VPAIVDAGEPPDELEFDDVAVVPVVFVVVEVVLAVVVVFDPSTPVPCSEMAKSSPSTSMVVDVDHGPGADGVNVYVNWHD